ncbi:MAG: hypothetical protein IPK13_01080 [Deltaproteobacteria bacterium]|nr:hypothetical protein [Deltaproteobacteria bacterium]
MKARCGRLVLGVCLILSSTSVSALAGPKTKTKTKETIKVGKPECVLVKDGIVLPIRGRPIDQGHLRCTASVAVPQKMRDPSLSLTVRVLQKPERETEKEERGRVERAFELWSGLKASIEIELPVPEDLNGCMPFSLVLEGAGRSQTFQALPDCVD